jgi:hypothetical protein
MVKRIGKSPLCAYPIRAPAPPQMALRRKYDGIGRCNIYPLRPAEFPELRGFLRNRNLCAIRVSCNS